MVARLIFIVLAAWLLTLLTAPVQADQAIWPQLQVIQRVYGLTLPSHITHANDGSDRLFISELQGRVRIVRAGVLQTAPFLDISDRTMFTDDAGLLSIAFPPDFRDKGYFYAAYTNRQNQTILARYYVDAANPDRADANSEEIVLVIPTPINPGYRHNGGQLAFNPLDGYLYLSVGDGGCDQPCWAVVQDVDHLRGKILRIDVEADETPYRVPADNPFVNTSGARPEIWAIGLRNPWRFSFDAATGDLYIGDVGETLWEEINFQVANTPGGANYGWAQMEGPNCFPSGSQCNNQGKIIPVYYYGHVSRRCSITGGHVYRGGYYPRMAGIYYFGDFCSGEIWGLRNEDAGWAVQPLLNTDWLITTFGLDEQGSLWVADWRGVVYRLGDSVVTTPTPTATPSPTSTPTATLSPTSSPTPTTTPSSTPRQLYLPLLIVPHA